MFNKLCVTNRLPARMRETGDSLTFISSESSQVFRSSFRENLIETFNLKQIHSRNTFPVRLPVGQVVSADRSCILVILLNDNHHVTKATGASDSHEHGNR